jgi:hypothetical protein
MHIANDGGGPLKPGKWPEGDTNPILRFYAEQTGGGQELVSYMWVSKINDNIDEQIKISYHVLTYSVITISVIHKAAFHINLLIGINKRVVSNTVYAIINARARVHSILFTQTLDKVDVCRCAISAFGIWSHQQPWRWNLRTNFLHSMLKK